MITTGGGQKWHNDVTNAWHNGRKLCPRWGDAKKKNRATNRVILSAVVVDVYNIYICIYGYTTYIHIYILYTKIYKYINSSFWYILYIYIFIFYMLCARVVIDHVPAMFHLGPRIQWPRVWSHGCGLSTLAYSEAFERCQCLLTGLGTSRL